MKKIRNILFITFTLIFFYFLQSSFSFNSKRKCKNYDISKIDSITSLAMRNGEVDDILIFGEENENFFLSEKLDKKQKMVIVFPFSENECDLEPVVKRIKRYQDRIGLNNIVVLAEFKDSKDYQSKKNNIDIDASFYRIPFGKSFKNELDKLQVPYMFLTNKSLKFFDLFVLVNENSGRIDRHLNFLFFSL